MIDTVSYKYLFHSRFFPATFSQIRDVAEEECCFVLKNIFNPIVIAFVFRAIQHKKFLFILSATLLSSATSPGQNKETGSSSIISVKATLYKKWSAFADCQLKSFSIYDRFYYYELKAGMTYSFLHRYSFTLGTGIYNAFDEGRDDEDYSKQKEVRLWEQFVMHQKLSVVEIEHRCRVEQRFTDDFENRFRYKLNVSVPINKKEIKANTLYTTVYNEFYFTENLPHFTKDQFQSGLGYVVNKNITLQSGWLRQVDFNRRPTRKKNYLLAAIYYKI